MTRISLCGSRDCVVAGSALVGLVDVALGTSACATVTVAAGSAAGATPVCAFAIPVAKVAMLTPSKAAVVALKRVMSVPLCRDDPPPAQGESCLSGFSRFETRLLAVRRAGRTRTDARSPSLRVT